MVWDNKCFFFGKALNFLFIGVIHFLSVVFLGKIVHILCSDAAVWQQSGKDIGQIGSVYHKFRALSCGFSTGGQGILFCKPD